MKNENVNINVNPILAGIPVELESDEPWRKARFSCSGSGRIEKRFDLKNLNSMYRDRDDNEENSGTEN